MNTGSDRVDRVLENSFIIVAWWLLLCVCSAAGACCVWLWKWALARP